MHMVKYLLFVLILLLQPFGHLFIAINGKFQLYIVLRLAAKVQKPVFWPKIVHDFLSKTLMLSHQSAFTASLKDIPWYLFSNFFSRHYRWTFFSHRSRVSQLDSLCSKGTLGNPLIP